MRTMMMWGVMTWKTFRADEVADVRVSLECLPARRAWPPGHIERHRWNTIGMRNLVAQPGDGAGLGWTVCVEQPVRRDHELSVERKRHLLPSNLPKFDLVRFDQLETHTRRCERSSPGWRGCFGERCHDERCRRRSAECRASRDFAFSRLSLELKATVPGSRCEGLSGIRPGSPALAVGQDWAKRPAPG
jgi:hypothetical protein